MKRKNNNLKISLLLLPSLLFFGIFMIWPTLYTFYLSFFDWNMVSPNKEFVGLENYIKLFTDSKFYSVLWQTLIYILILLIINFVFPYIFAFVLEFLIPKFKDFFKSAYFLPSFISMVVGSMIYTWLLNPTSGPVAEIVGWFGFSIPNWTTSSSLVIFVICLITAWKVFGYHFINLYAAIAGIDQEVIESAKLDGVGNIRMFFDIVIPMSSSAGLYVLIMTIVTGLQYVYTPIAVVTQGGPDGASSNLIYESYHNAFVTFNTGYSAAYSIVTLVIFMVLLIVLLKFSDRSVYYAN